MTDVDVAVATCPVCEASLALAGEPRPAEIVQCADCGSELEVVAVAPVSLALAPEAEEDWGE